MKQTIISDKDLEHFQDEIINWCVDKKLFVGKEKEIAIIASLVLVKGLELYNI